MLWTTECLREQRETLIALDNPRQVVQSELLQSRVLRAVYSQRQLQEVMTDFWLNHFNIFQGKTGEEIYSLVPYERDVIRPNALGSFEVLLDATATSTAMMTYLDNAGSTGPHSFNALGPPGRPLPAKGGAPKGLNENYARELMELHTLGVNGGYTQRDVTEVAKVFTGWTIEQPPKGGPRFVFDESRHEPGMKRVLGVNIKENGYQGRSRGIAPAGDQPGDGTLYLPQAGGAFCERRPAAEPGGPLEHGLSGFEWQHRRSDAVSGAIAGVLVRHFLSRKDQDS